MDQITILNSIQPLISSNLSNSQYQEFVMEVVELLEKKIEDPNLLLVYYYLCGIYNLLIE